MEDPEELDSSELGTQSYWDSAYSREIKNFDETGDVGEIWFGEDSMLRVIRWLLKCDSVLKDDPIVDLGCGNGMTLVELAREGYLKLTGLDYSEPAIKLAESVSKEECPQIQYEVFDVLSDDISRFDGAFKVVHDKGTYDAVSLHPDNPKGKRTAYIANVRRMMRADGLFVITSCNWTESELRDHFKGVFRVERVLPTPQFKFGGKVGNVVTSVVFSIDSNTKTTHK